MAGESVEVLLARMDERLSTVIHEQEESKQGRKEQYAAMEAIRLTIAGLKTDVETVNKQLAFAQPTINEFVTIKNKVAGAGKLGHWLWIVGAFLIGLAFKSREAIAHWFPHGGQ